MTRSGTTIESTSTDGISGPGGELGIVVLDDPTDPAQGVRVIVRRTTVGGTLVVESSAGVPIDTVPLEDVGRDGALVVEVFADTVRCRCGDAGVSVPRGDRGTGGCVLLATNARVTSLHVHGLDMYRQPFRTSRTRALANTSKATRAWNAMTPAPQRSPSPPCWPGSAVR